ncbi:MAG: Unknown protein [uncultured Thiotrichaceae bacterium]|uniref:Thioredoxin domain-containing protein n=1 Tax=uncultured Thiotrichaceae bacterium TaxID=298394 RepID=A0A6S6SLK8_9GAMM|nr:MAG: Unknown protein [uncultured Thiotrichaceae bacterium]
MKRLLLLITLIIPFSFSSFVHAEQSKESTPAADTEEARLSDWENFFDDSLNELPEELDIAKEEGKKGLLIMFEMDECPFCKRMKKTILNRSNVQDYYKDNFRIISIDTEGDLELIDFKGETTTQKDFSLKQFRVRATPVYLFVDLEGKPVKNGRLSGATKDINEFMMLGKYIAEKHNEEMTFTRFKRNEKSKEQE